MTDYTLNYSLPFPESNDGVVVHSDIERLAKRADTTLESAKQDATNAAAQDATTKANAAQQAAALDATTKANAARDAAIQDAATKYGVLPGRVTSLETLTGTHTTEISNIKTDAQSLSDTVETQDTELGATKNRVTSLENLTTSQATDLVQVDGRLNAHNLWLARNEDAIHDVETQIDGVSDGVQQAAASASEAQQSANSAWQANTELVPRVEHIETMAGLAPGEVTDAQTANLISQPGTDTRVALNESYASRSSVIQHVKDFGATGDGVTDDTAALQAAVEAGVPLYWGGPNDRYRLTGRLFQRTTAPTYWVADGATLFCDAASVIQYFVHVEQQGHAFRIEGTLHIDANRQSHSCLYLVNNSETHVDVTLLDLSVANAYRASQDFTGGEGIHLRGAFRNVTIERPRVVNIGMAPGAVIPGTQGVTGISVTAFNYLKAPQKVTIIDPYIDGVYDEDTTSNIDQDGIKVFAAEDRDGVLTPYESSFNIMGGHIRNCGGRAIKSQMEWGSVSNLKIYRGQERTQGGPDIDFQIGGGKATDIEVQYEGNAGSAVVNFSGPATTGKMVPHGSVDGIKAVIVGEQTPESLITFNQRGSIKSKVTVRDIEILGNQPSAVLRMNGVSGGVHDAAISDVFAAPSISLVRGGFGSPNGWTGNVMASNCLNTGSVPKPLYTSISGGLAAPAISRSNCPKYT